MNGHIRQVENPRDGLEEATLALASRIEKRADAIAREMVEAFKLELTVYRDAAPELVTEMFHHSLGAIQAGLYMLREGTTRLPEPLREVYAELGRARAQEDFPLHAVVCSFQIGVRVLFNHVVNDALPQKELAAPLLARTLRLAFDVVAESVSIISESYTEERRRIDDGRRQLSTDLLEKLLLDPRDPSLPGKALAYGLPQAPAYAALAATHSQVTFEEPTSRREAESIARSFFTRSRTMVMWGYVGGLLAAAVPLFGDQRTCLNRLATDLTATLQKRMGQGWIVAVGRPYPELAGAGRSLHEALGVAQLASRLSLNGTVMYEEVLAEHLLATSPDLMSDLVQIIQPVLEHDASHQDHLIHTLRCWLRNDLSIQKTARDLHVHRNTLRSRLQRLEQLVGAKPSKKRLPLELALCALDLTGETPRPAGRRATKNG